MSLYGTSLYSTFYYGTDEFGSPGGGPAHLNSYQNVDGSVVLYWGLEPCSASLNAFTWTVDTDLVPTFDSARFRTYSSIGNPNFIDGWNHNGLVVPDYIRAQGEDTPMYWRVRGNLGGADTAYGISVYSIHKAIDQVVRQEMLDSLPDIIYKKDFASGEQQILGIVFEEALITGNVYNLTVNGVALTTTAFAVNSDATLAVIAGKIALVPGIAEAIVISGGPGTSDDREIRIKSAAKDQPILLSGSVVIAGASQTQNEIVLRNSTNVNRVYNAAGQELDLASIEAIFTDTDIVARLVRDKSLRKNLGAMLELLQPSTMKTIDFREVLRALMREASNTPSYAAVSRVLAVLYCQAPTFILIRDTLGTYVDDPSSTPPVDPFWVDDPLSLPPVDPETVWDDHHLAFGVIIQINNPLGLTVPPEFVRAIVDKLVPVHAPIFITGI